MKKPTWWVYFRADLSRYMSFKQAGALSTFLRNQGLWALLQYRVASAVHTSHFARWARIPMELFLAIWHKIIEMATGISLPETAIIGPGLYIAHFGNVFLHGDTRIGENCTIGQGVTVGISGRGDYRGVPTIGDRVYIATSAVVIGKIVVGDDAVIGANSLVNRDVAPNTTVLGVPAVVIRDRRSDDSRIQTVSEAL